MASYEKRNGKYSVRFRYLDCGIEKNKRKSGFERKKDAKEYYERFMAEVRNRDYAPIIKKVTYQSLLYQFIDYKKDYLRTSTYTEMNSALKKHVIPYWGKLFVDEITKKHVENWQIAMRKKGYAHGTIKKIRGFINSSFVYALDNNLIQINPVANTKLPKNNKLKKEMLIWTPEEFEKFIKVVDCPIYRAFFILLYYTGCRRGEALGLTWKDYDRKYIYINKSYTNRTKGGYGLTPPKNEASYRKVLLPQCVIAELDKLPKNGERIFGHLPFQTITNKKDEYIKKAKVKRIRIHDFRHSHASLMIKNGCSIVLVAKRLGHSNIEMTLNTYSHLLPSEESDFIKELGKK